MWQPKAGRALLMCAVLCVSAAAQGGGSKRKGAGAKMRDKGAGEALTLEEQFALTVLDQLLSSSKEFEDDRLRIRTRSLVADILWSYDEPRARGLFKEAFEAIASAKLEDRNEAPSAAPLGAASPALRLQSEVLGLVTRRDPDLAESLITSLDAARGGDDPKPAADKERAGRRGLYLEAAASITDADPQRAVRLAEAGLDGGIDPSVVRVLLALRQNSPAQADALYKSVLTAARRDIGHASVNLTILASYALPGFTTAGSFGGSPQYVVADERATGPAAVELLNFAFETYTGLAYPTPTAPEGARPAVEPNPIDYMTGQRLQPFFRKYLPDKDVLFRGALETIAGRVRQKGLMDAVSKLTQSGGTDELAKQAESVKDPFQRDMLYFRASLSASGEGEFDRALSLAEKVADADFRGGLDSLIRFQAASDLLGKGEVDSALRYAHGVSDVRQRAFMFAKIGRVLLDKKDVAGASGVLRDGEKTVGGAKDGPDKAQAMLLITDVKVRLDPVQGFSAMEGTVKAFNDADSARGKTDAAPAGSMMTMVLGGLFKMESPDFAPSFYLLARTDFNRAAQLAQRLTRKDRAVLAQVAACRGVLVRRAGRGRELTTSVR